MSLLQQIASDVESIIQAEIDTMALRFVPIQPGDNRLGVFESDQAKRLLALSFQYNKQSAQFLVDSYGGSQGSMRAAQALAAEMDELGDITRDLAWLEIKRELGPTTWAGMSSLSIREGFEVVGIRENDSAERPDIKFLGALNISDIMRNAITEMVKRSPNSPFRPKHKEREEEPS